MNTTFEQQPIAAGESEPGIEYISFKDLEAEYRANRDLAAEQSKCQKMVFRQGGQEITDLTGYNTSQPIFDFSYDRISGQPYVVLAVRMEPRDSESDSRVLFFKADRPTSTAWDLMEDETLPVMRGQDPSAAKIGRELLISVVEVEPVPDDTSPKPRLKWRSGFYRGPDIRHLTYSGQGPDDMKNITPVELPSGRILTFTRPQHPGSEELGGLGQIGAVVAGSIGEIMDPEVLQNAPMIKTRFLPGEEWGGIKVGVPLIDGRVGVIGHVSRFLTESPLYDPDGKDKPKKYATLSAKYNPVTRQLEDMKIEALADEFVGVEPKNEYLEDVVYTTAITNSNDSGQVALIQGVGDAETWQKRIDDPFAGLRYPFDR